MTAVAESIELIQSESGAQRLQRRRVSNNAAEQRQIPRSSFGMTVVEINNSLNHYRQTLCLEAYFYLTNPRSTLAINPIASRGSKSLSLLRDRGILTCLAFWIYSLWNSAEQNTSAQVL